MRALPITIAARPLWVNVTVCASGLNDPRGLTIGPDGNLYVLRISIPS
jgi:hypothetical protein